VGKFTLTNSKIYYGQYDLPGDFSECAVDVGTAAVEGAAFGDLVKTMYPGVDTAKLGAAGFFDPDALGVQADPVLQAAVGVAGPVITVSPVSGAEGETCYSMQALVSEYDPLAGVSVGGMAKFKLSAEAASRMIRGTLLRNTKFTGTPDSVTGTGSIFQLGAIAAGQSLWAALHIFAITGSASPTLTAKIQSATTGGFGSPTDRLTFAAQTAIGSVWATPVAGPITDQFWRCSFTISGTTPAFTWAILMGIL
jgi:hypothetical protein